MDNKTSSKPSYAVWLNLTLAACGVFFFCCLLGDIFGYSFCKYCWNGGLFNESYLPFLSFLESDNVRFVVFLTCFYLSTGISYIIIYSVVNLLINLKKNIIFDKVNTRYMTAISVCCFLICLVCIIGACASYALFLISLIGLFVGLIVQCVRLVMDKAIDMRSELDLTV
ncbi:MAG: DUF2975 domain-containing protein [Clostridiales bacterium]|nr:DUF2975 domain-containing protein [Clostridiales bacterium]